MKFKFNSERINIMKETQKTITEWAQETFGPTHPFDVGCRMMVEVEELMDKLGQIKKDPVAKLTDRIRYELIEECADIAIMLDQVVELLGGDLPETKDSKMSINRNRRWEWDDTKQQTRHVTEFKLNGYILELGRWYVMNSDGEYLGGFYDERAAGFDSKHQALSWINRVELSKKVVIPEWDPELTRWQNYGDDEVEINVVYGRDLYDYGKTINLDPRCCPPCGSPTRYKSFQIKAEE